MEDSLKRGDIIIVNKLVYGLKVPIIFGDMNLLHSSNSSLIPEIGTSNPKYLRLSGYGDYEKGDIILFWKDDEIFVKRCVALPGDTIEIITGRLFINSMLVEEDENVKRKYRVWTNNTNSTRKQMFYDTNLNFKEFVMLSSDKNTDSIRVLPIPVDTINRTFYHNKYWSEDFFGPYVVPKKGYRIEMDTTNFWQYSRAINRSVHPSKMLSKQGDRILQGSKEIHSYTFLEDHFFVLGDNRSNSHDSRYSGAVSEDKIIGKAFAVVISIDQNGVIWNRLFSRL